VLHLVLIDREVSTLIHEPFDSSSSIIRITPIQGIEIAGSVSSLYGAPSVVMGVPNETGIQVTQQSIRNMEQIINQ
jgi:hypothetical protein